MDNVPFDPILVCVFAMQKTPFCALERKNYILVSLYILLCYIIVIICPKIFSRIIYFGKTWARMNCWFIHDFSSYNAYRVIIDIWAFWSESDFNYAGFRSFKICSKTKGSIKLIHHITVLVYKFFGLMICCKFISDCGPSLFCAYRANKNKNRKVSMGNWIIVWRHIYE